MLTMSSIVKTQQVGCVVVSVEGRLVKCVCVCVCVCVGVLVVLSDTGESEG